MADTYGEPGKNPYRLPGSNRRFSNVVNAKTGVTQIYQQSSQFVFSSVATYNPSNNKITVDPNASLNVDEIKILNDNKSQIKAKAIDTASVGIRAADPNIDATDARNQATKLISSGSSGTNPVAPTPPPDPAPDSATEGGADLSAFEDPNIEADKQQSEGNFGSWAYPTDIGNNEQDFIKFTMIEYLSKPLQALQTSERFDNDKRKKTRLGTVILPIQPTITDTNTVDWQQEGINPLQSAGARFALAASGKDPGSAISATVEEITNNLSDNQSSFKDYLRIWAAGQAVGVNLLSRVGGAVVNPNMELLFNGPQLRAFNFSFRLSPRDETEAAQVKNIIRFFKQGMAVRKSAKGVFLKTPNIFDIQYCFKTADTVHPALSQIKTCALTSCAVDYTPDGSYMTFSDGTMTSYNLTLQFSELEPIYDSDYEGYPNNERSQIVY
jgi:hypothetical protein